MSFERELQKRSESKCELCGLTDTNTVYAVPHSPSNKLEQHLWICQTCHTQMGNIETADENH